MSRLRWHHLRKRLKNPAILIDRGILRQILALVSPIISRNHGMWNDLLIGYVTGYKCTWIFKGAVTLLRIYTWSWVMMAFESWWSCSMSHEIIRVRWPCLGANSMPCICNSCHAWKHPLQNGFKTKSTVYSKALLMEKAPKSFVASTLTTPLCSAGMLSVMHVAKSATSDASKWTSTIPLDRPMAYVVASPCHSEAKTVMNAKTMLHSHMRKPSLATNHAGQMSN